MANLKALKVRIGSVKNTRQITKAMKMVAAAKLRKATEQAESARPYSKRMSRMMHSLAPAAAGRDNAPELLVGRGDVKKVNLVVYTADRGLCGSFNSVVIRATRARIAELEKQGFQVMLTFIGRKAYDVLKRSHGHLVRKVYTEMSRHMSFAYVEKNIVKELIKDFHEGQFDACYLVFNQFKSAMSQELTWAQSIPQPIDTEGASTQTGYQFEPVEEELLEELLPRNLAVQVFQALAESEASEHGSRMTAMDNAVRNAGDMVKKLQTKYNRSRQAAITTELIEIISGAESLKG
ncbi:ATP synthase F1 subcomplex gamma subunit [Magnetococcus marinus MC-1]|uniref:ATP synthase gamma chain n=1 Tax=Magnetococcus marinus (strain ATCC BAA-1437 / JCM 17883 / MC-1) TaxID=156889 RepID=ATPG_MAGMM|nr:F0F1 ATP synthase subunit gamma [Magnetococcus marinus]A0LDA1.1 RecName: Full=ATP synthase gamma chain; AltName: Full=ATP synthase F1 sector gamma subunit; AltName: Full=F-ATPase gamma subunit [Magnetococcus marinus MC-1]ABK45944.1 ATP synthase F1 subcomplex gamma subunit [Magnetococcus marinus MC-1]